MYAARLGLIRSEALLVPVVDTRLPGEVPILRWGVLPGEVPFAVLAHYSQETLYNSMGYTQWCSQLTT